MLARRLQVPLRDYAVGGARSTYGNYDVWIDAYADTGLQGQIDTWQASLKGAPADPKALYLISASTNDYCQFHDFKQAGVLPVEGVSPLNYAAKGAQTAANVGWAVRRLRASGAQHIVVFSSYAIAESPLIVTVDPQVADARSFAEHFDAVLPSAVVAADVVIFPLGAAMRDLMTHAHKYGLSDVTHPCQPTAGKSARACATPDAFFWWDEIHPTARVHTLLAEALLRRLL